MKPIQLNTTGVTRIADGGYSVYLHAHTYEVEHTFHAAPPQKFNEWRGSMIIRLNKEALIACNATIPWHGYLPDICASFMACLFNNRESASHGLLMKQDVPMIAEALLRTLEHRRPDPKLDGYNLWHICPELHFRNRYTAQAA